MLDYFVSFLKSFNVVNETVMASWLLVARVTKNYPFLNPGVNLAFDELYGQIEDLEGVFSAIDDTDLKRDFLEEAKANPSWPEVFVRLFPYYMNRYIIDELTDAGEEKMLQSLAGKILDNYREYREAFIWLVRTLPDEWFRTFDVTYEKILIGMIHLLDITFREIENRREVSENRKMNRQINNYLFKDSRLEEFLLSADEDS